MLGSFYDLPEERLQLKKRVRIRCRYILILMDVITYFVELRSRQVPRLYILRFHQRNGCITWLNILPLMRPQGKCIIDSLLHHMGPSFESTVFIASQGSYQPMPV